MAVHLPDEEVTPIWDKMSAYERDWYERFVMADRYGNMKELRRLCDEAPSDKFEYLKAQIEYERNASQRNTFTLPEKRGARFSELDYAWSSDRVKGRRESATSIKNKIIQGQDYIVQTKRKKSVWAD